MRITGGNFRGRSFSPPNVEGFRPTMEKVRQAIFSMLDTIIDLEGKTILDCYSGSGAFGLEAISRGASHVTFIEKNPELIKFTSTAVEKLGIQSSAKLIKGTLPKEFEKLRSSFDLVFSDPPYLQKSGDFVDKVLECDIIGPEGLLILETAKIKNQSDEEPAISTLELLRDKTYGDTRVRLYQKQ
jgi:16S rRNA (guanine966-N2)-methyltransferase